MQMAGRKRRSVSLGPIDVDPAAKRREFSPVINVSKADDPVRRASVQSRVPAFLSRSVKVAAPTVAGFRGILDSRRTPVDRGCCAGSACLIVTRNIPRISSTLVHRLRLRTCKFYKMDYAPLHSRWGRVPTAGLALSGWIQGIPQVDRRLAGGAGASVGPSTNPSDCHAPGAGVEARVASLFPDRRILAVIRVVLTYFVIRRPGRVSRRRSCSSAAKDATWELQPHGIARTSRPATACVVEKWVKARRRRTPRLGLPASEEELDRSFDRIELKPLTPPWGTRGDF